MSRPDGPNSRYVPLASVWWHWGGDAKARSGNAGSDLLNPSQDQLVFYTPSGFPTWSDNLLDKNSGKEWVRQ